MDIATLCHIRDSKKELADKDPRLMQKNMLLQTSLLAEMCIRLEGLRQTIEMIHRESIDH